MSSWESLEDYREYLSHIRYSLKKGTFVVDRIEGIWVDSDNILLVMRSVIGDLREDEKTRIQWDTVDEFLSGGRSIYQISRDLIGYGKLDKGSSPSLDILSKRVDVEGIYMKFINSLDFEWDAYRIYIHSVEGKEINKHNIPQVMLPLALWFSTNRSLTPEENLLFYLEILKKNMKSLSKDFRLRRNKRKRN